MSLLVCSPPVIASGVPTAILSIGDASIDCLLVRLLTQTAPHRLQFSLGAAWEDATVRLATPAEPGDDQPPIRAAARGSNDPLTRIIAAC